MFTNQAIGVAIKGLWPVCSGQTLLCEICFETESETYVNNRALTTEKSVNSVTLFLHSVFRVMRWRLAPVSHNNILTPG